MIRREGHIGSVNKLLAHFPVVAILGPRQCGKTTLARQIPYDHFFDLENTRDLAHLLDDAQLALEGLKGLIVIDEIQRRPDLFPLLRHLVDTQKKQKYLILGSASRDLIRQSSESLAGRIAYHEMGGFNLSEIPAKIIERLWIRGGYPPSFLARTQEISGIWRENYIQTFLERDLPQLGIQIPAQTLRRFWTMLSHYHGQIINYSELGRSFGISDMTARKYVDLLEGTFILRLLQPWSVNTGKRLIKSPKIYLRDSGLFHSLQGVPSKSDLLNHPKIGASWEGFALEMATQALSLSNEELYFWGTHAGAELDAFWRRRGKNWGIEFKYASAPTKTKSMLSALQDLKLEHFWVIYPGPETYPIDRKITALPLHQIPKVFEKGSFK